jgi:hypothetical protein
MISRSRLREIGKRTGLHLYQQEKDYLLKLFLYNYFRRFNDAVFKGGTCIKYLFGTERFSEDMDFNIISSPPVFEQQVKKILKEINYIGINTGFIKSERFTDAYTCEIWFHGPLYEGTSQTRNRFRIDAGKRGGVVRNPKWRLIYSEYPETKERFLIYTMDEQEILIEKIITLIERKKGRDLYDTWFLLKSGVKIDPGLFYRKIENKRLENIGKIISKEEYERDMEKLTTVMLPYEQIKREVKKELEVLQESHL